MVSDASDVEHMRRALELAERGWGRVAPNPLVGAVVVNEGAVVGEGWHQEYGGPHAEVHALRNAGAGCRGATLYVTLEPCSHHGKTPPCTDAIIASGVARVIFAASDPNPRARGGAEVLRAAGVEVIAGMEEQQACDQNAAFFHRFGAPKLPWTALKLAVSLDAAVADLAGRSQWITGEQARAETHRLRAGFDAIAVGIGTALADDPRLTVRGGVVPSVPPVRIVFDRDLRLPPDSALGRSAREVPVWVVSRAAHPARRGPLEAAGVKIVEAYSISEALAALRDRGIASLLCEGGSGIAASLLEAGAVNRLYLFYAPILLGVGAQRAFGALAGTQLDQAHRWRSLGAKQFGDDTLLTLAV